MQYNAHCHKEGIVVDFYKKTPIQYARFECTIANPNPIKLLSEAMKTKSNNHTKLHTLMAYNYAGNTLYCDIFLLQNIEWIVFEAVLDDNWQIDVAVYQLPWLLLYMGFSQHDADGFIGIVEFKSEWSDICG